MPAILIDAVHFSQDFVDGGPDRWEAYGIGAMWTRGSPTRRADRFEVYGGLGLGTHIGGHTGFGGLSLRTTWAKPCGLRATLNISMPRGAALVEFGVERIIGRPRPART